MADNFQGETSNRYRLLMTADTVGGVWQYAIDLVSELSRRGFDILLATMGPRPSDAQRREAKEIEKLTLVESDWALEWMPSPWTDVDAAGDWLLTLQDEFQPDAIHLNGYVHAALPWGRPVVTVAHSCVCSWWRAVYGESAGPEWELYKSRVAAGLRASTVIAAPSRSMARSLEREYGIPHDSLEVVHNFSRVPMHTNLQKNPVILAAGRFWDPAKNLRILDEIANRLPWRIRVAGSGSHIAGHSVDSRSVTLLGLVPHAELMQEMDHAAIFVHPALYEPFGLAVLEAARAQCCLVLSDIPSLRELWDDAAVFIDPRDTQAWAAELNRLANHPEIWTAFGQKAQVRSQKYRPEVTVAEYLGLYQRMSSAAGDQQETAA